MNLRGAHAPHVPSAAETIVPQRPVTRGYRWRSQDDIVGDAGKGLFRAGVSGLGLDPELQKVGADRVCDSPEAVAQLNSDPA